MADLRISVAMTTFNGESHVLEQLQSFSAQSLLPHELVICDDTSTDQTVPLLEEFARKAPFSVRICVNPTRLGYAKNFEKAIQMCTGEIVILSDQDDVWRSEKIRTVADTFNADPSVAFVVCNADIVDEKLRPLGQSLWEKEGFTLSDATENRLDCKYAKLIQTRLAHGCCLAFRAKLRDEMLPIPQIWAHDAWIVLFLGALYQYKYIPERLNAYRQHATQTTGSRFTFTQRVMRRVYRPPPKQYLSAMGERFRILEAAVGRQPSSQTSCTLPVIRDAQRHYELRASGRASIVARLPYCVRELVSGRYQRYSKGILTFIDDLLARRGTSVTKP